MSFLKSILGLNTFSSIVHFFFFFCRILRGLLHTCQQKLKYRYLFKFSLLYVKNITTTVLEHFYFNFKFLEF